MTVWVDATAGASGDMLLGALVGAGADVTTIRSAVDAVIGKQATLTRHEVDRCGLAATRVEVAVVESDRVRTWPLIRELLADADLDETVLETATAVFERLAGAEAAVHGIEVDDVHFHEVGALDSIADVVGVCAGFAALGPGRIVVSPIAVGSGRVRTDHGNLAVPVPAVVELLRGAPTTAGPGEGESCTPTGAALLATLADEWGAQPPMTVERVGTGAGGRDPETHANVVRILVGDEAGTAPDPGGPLLLETNVDDLDPRLWPDVLARLLSAGASDAWLTPILMKKGRPAHTLAVLVGSGSAAAVREEIFRSTTTLGLRETTVGKSMLERRIVTVTVEGHPVRVKLGLLHGEVVNAQPEFEDVRRVAAEVGASQKQILAAAVAAYRSE